ncbi:menaquinone-specific isochorismate synthase [Proteus hauseri ATCC 700826]|uniref:Isochorismate synthase MenF n=1 Tax=Proteus hauseri ATCC 700826 TaxID=1354271 RepID=A0AAJ3HR92_PROHU|nr:isochorismate synthase [Proteus hauseri]OAT46058.1 menaquinone-specific isochorismate synthase [Proteus hauseri ATCC 700826]
MEKVKPVFSTLYEKVKNINLTAQGNLLHLKVALASDVSFSLLSWLAAQTYYPQFYWQHRDEYEEIAACGQLCCFNHIRDAREFLSTHKNESNTDDVRIWGLNAWDTIIPGRIDQQSGDDAYLFLPRIEIRRQQQQLSVHINLLGEKDRDDALTFLSTLNDELEISPLSVSVISVKHSLTQDQWVNYLELALHEIEQGTFEKVVPARATCLTLDNPLKAIQFMKASRDVNHHCYHYMLAFSPSDAFIGSSPERLYYRDEKQLYTEALAGTVASSENEQQAMELADWLMNDKKNQHENLVVVDDICQRLQGGIEGIDVSPADVIRLRKVQHLRRYIHGKLIDTDDVDCLKRLQPTAAVCGLPRTVARAFIHQHEPFKRRWYAGSAGYLGLSHAEFAVSLRCGELHDDTLTLYAGAGVVAGSSPLQEWDEIENKAAGLRTLLQEKK